LGDITVDELHFEGSKVVRVGHLVGILDYEGEFLLEEVDSDDVVHCVRE
jgi:hypothetical protein